MTSNRRCGPNIGSFHRLDSLPREGALCPFQATTQVHRVKHNRAIRQISRATVVGFGRAFRKDDARGHKSLPPLYQCSHEKLLARGQERFGDPALAAEISDCPAGPTVDPGPGEDETQPRSSPNAPSLADRPSASKRPPVPPDLRPRSAGPTARVVPARSPGSGLPGPR